MMHETVLKISENIFGKTRLQNWHLKITLAFLKRETAPFSLYFKKCKFAQLEAYHYDLKVSNMVTPSQIFHLSTLNCGTEINCENYCVKNKMTNENRAAKQAEEERRHQTIGSVENK